MIAIRNSRDLEAMRESCRFAARVRDAVAAKITPGATTLELSEYAGELILAGGGVSAFLGYRGFPAVICASVNEAVVHGIPDRRRIALGDIVSIDVGVRYKGFIGDTATTVMVGVTDRDVVRLVSTTQRALEAGIAQACAGRRLSDVSHAIEAQVVAEGFSVVREFVGHGVGTEMHEEPQIPNFGAPGRGPVLRAGMTLALEPMVNMGKADVSVLADGWTVVTKDRKASAHFEHTIAVRDGAAEVLTA